MNKAALFVWMLVLIAGSSIAQNKGLDPSFGNSGIARTDIYTNKKFKTPTRLIIQPDGKILISGNFIARYKTDGTPDSSFAVNGFFLPPYTDINYSITPVNARAIALLGDGKILMVGKWDSSCYYIARLLPDGTIDSTFGQNGISRNNGIDPWNILAQPDGKILIIGNGCSVFGGSEDSVTLSRFLADGSVDTAFGKQGFTRAYLGNYGGSITNMGLLPDGRIAMGGIGYNDSGYRAVIVLRFLPDGKLDTTLGGTGRIFPFYAWYSRAFATLPDGKILLIFEDGNNNQDVIRLNTDGSVDTTFGTGGHISIVFTSLGILPLQDGRILCNGILNGDAGILCLKKDGKGLDSSFGQNGTILTDLTGYWRDFHYFLALQSDNKIVACGAGQLNKNSPASVYITRYNADAAVGVSNKKNIPEAVFTIAPNPAKTYVKLSGISLSQVASIRLLSVDGHIVGGLNTLNSLTIPVGEYAPGTYLLRITLKTGVAIYGRFVVAP